MCGCSAPVIQCRIQFRQCSHIRVQRRLAPIRLPHLPATMCAGQQRTQLVVLVGFSQKRHSHEFTLYKESAYPRHQCAMKIVLISCMHVKHRRWVIVCISLYQQVLPSQPRRPPTLAHHKEQRLPYPTSTQTPRSPQQLATASRRTPPYPSPSTTPPS